MGSLSISMGRLLQITFSGKPINRQRKYVSLLPSMLATYINSWQKLPPVIQKQIMRGLPVSAISQQQEAYSCYKSQNRFPPGNAGKLSAMNFSSLQWNLHGYGQATFDCLQPLKLFFFLLFKKRVPLILENKMSTIQCGMKACQLIPLYTSVKSRWIIPLIDNLV